MMTANEPALLKNYCLPGDVMRLAPRRPFKGHGEMSLAHFLKLLRTTPEMRGPMSSAARRLGLAPQAVATDHWLIIEVHIDARNMSPNVADALLRLGFELDGFVQFLPRDFTDHYTLKFKVPIHERERCRELAALARSKASHAEDILVEAPEIEAYIESEIYSWRHRRYWAAQPAVTPFEMPFPLRAKELIATAELSPKARKRADIHIKLDLPESRVELARAFVAAGFYEVRTWSGNLVLSAQFERAGLASSIFNRLEEYFNRAGGAREMSIEYCTAMWRSTLPDGRLATIPPILCHRDSIKPNMA